MTASALNGPTIPAAPAPRAPLGVDAEILRPTRTYATPPAILSTFVNELTITAAVAEDGAISPLLHGATGRVRADAPEAWLYLRRESGRRLWCVIPAIPTGNARHPAAIRRYLTGWMAAGNFAALRNSEAVVGWYGAVAIHDHREWPAALTPIT
jgi:hypothetical protein